jgi:multidrug efflux pump subunit AcrA (membrane-fusion protein)
MPTAKRRTQWWIAGVAAAAVILAAGAAVARLARDSGDSPEGGGAPAKAKTAAIAPAGETAVVSVTVAPIVARKVQRSVQAVGTFNGFDEVTVMAEVPGRVAKVFHEVGDVVRPGDVLLEIDPTDYELAVEETRRALELEASRIGLPVPSDENFNPERILAILRTSFDVNKLPTVQRAKEQEENAKGRLERAKQLRQSHSISEEEYDQRSTDYQVAVNARLQSQMDAQSVLAGIKHRLVLLKITERKLKYTKVVVPTPTKREGIPPDVQYAVSHRKVTEGEMVKDASGSSAAAFGLVMDKVLKLQASVPERFVGQVQVGKKGAVRVEAFPDKVFAGVVTRVNPMVDRISRAFDVEIRVDNPNRELKAGGFGRVDILTHEDPQAWTVPVESVVTFVGSTKVFVIRDGKAHVVPIAPGVEGQGWIELVRSASPELRLQDQVITSGLERLAEGVPVRVREAEEKDAETKSAK